MEVAPGAQVMQLTACMLGVRLNERGGAAGGTLKMMLAMGIGEGIGE